MKLDKLKCVWCAIFGCSRIMDVCMGYLSCARCGAHAGDNLAGPGRRDGVDSTGACSCDKCVKNAKGFTWRRDWFMVSKKQKAHAKALARRRP